MFYSLNSIPQHTKCIICYFSEGKLVIEKLAYFKKCLEDVLLYYQMPLPAIIGQSVHVGTWIFMIVSAFAAQPWCDHEVTFWYFLQVFFIGINSLFNYAKA